MEREFDYYKVHRKRDDSIPLLSEDDGCPDYLSERTPIKNPELMLFKISKPIPKKPKMADAHFSPDTVISEKIFDVMSPRKLEGVQLLPATIRGIDDEIFSGYWAIHIYNRIQCVDIAKSDCVIKSYGISKVKKIVLDRKVLEALPLEKRLVFRLKEGLNYQLFHISLVEKIMAVNPDGIRFTDIGEWTDRSHFQG